MGVSGAATADWLEVARFRKRDARVILPLTCVAAVGALVWLPPRFVLPWFVVNMALQLVNQLICRRLAQRGGALTDAASQRGEMALAGFTFAETVFYALLPAALLAHGDPAATVAAMAMIAAIALSAASELSASRPISLSALAAVALLTTAGLLLSPYHGGPAALGAAAIAVIGMYAYVLEAAFHREATERRLAGALAAARAKEAEAEAANAAKSVFLATMSHEIRTPLNGVLGMAQVMARDPLTPVQRERLEVIAQSGEALTALLNNVLDLSKIEAGQMELEMIAFDLEEVLASAQAAFAPLAAEKGLALRLSTGPGARARFEGDPTRLRQILYNLLSNAVKFTEAGEVELMAEVEGAGLRLAVRDTGPGLGPEDQQRLFQRFTQIDASTTRRHGGSGLGLAIAHELCALMGGRLRVESAEGAGATFIAEVPLRPIDPEPERPADAAALADARPAGPRLRILAAEDNPVNRKVLLALLAPLDVETTVVENGAEVVAAWAGGDFDIILMDVRMPVMDGLAATRAIRAQEGETGRPRTPIIGLSADAMAHQVEELLAAGMDDHVPKPIEVARLYAVLGAA